MPFQTLGSKTGSPGQGPLPLRKQTAHLGPGVSSALWPHSDSRSRTNPSPGLHLSFCGQLSSFPCSDKKEKAKWSEYKVKHRLSLIKKQDCVGHGRRKQGRELINGWTQSESCWVRGWDFVLPPPFKNSLRVRVQWTLGWICVSSLPSLLLSNLLIFQLAL